MTTTEPGAAVFGFRVGYATGRPVVPDQAHTFVTVLGEDTFAGLAEARWTAVAMASGARANSMITSAELVHVEL